MVGIIIFSWLRITHRFIAENFSSFYWDPFTQIIKNEFNKLWKSSLMIVISPMTSRFFIENGFFNFCVGETVGGKLHEVSRVLYNLIEVSYVFSYLGSSLRNVHTFMYFVPSKNYRCFLYYMSEILSVWYYSSLDEFGI